MSVDRNFIFPAGTTMTAEGLFQGPFGGGRVANDEEADSIPARINLGRRSSVSAESMSTHATRPPDMACFPKTESQEARLLSALNANMLFRQLDPEQGQQVVMAMREVRIPNGHIIIKQGDDGDYCYVTESGSLDVYVQPPEMPTHEALAAPPDKLGTKVMTYGPGSLFGDLALLYMQPRAASIVATSDCVLWAMDRVTFRSILAKADMQRRIMFNSFLRQVPLLQHLREDERSRVFDAIQLEDYRAGEVVLKEGDTGTEFFFVVNGIAEVIKADNKEQPVTLLKRGDYFGELALLNQAPRAATVIASSRSHHGVMRVAVLQKEAFTRLLGPLSDLMNRHAVEHYGTSLSTRPTTPAPPGGEQGTSAIRSSSPRSHS